LADTVDIVIPVEAAVALTDERKREAVGRIVSRILRPQPGHDPLLEAMQRLGAEGKEVSVREALALIKATLDAALAEWEGDFDADSCWALACFEQNGFAEGGYDVAETLSKAKNTSVAAMSGKDGILESRRGKVRLLKPEEPPPG
jgi:putative DNA methylase